MTSLPYPHPTAPPQDRQPLTALHCGPLKQASLPRYRISHQQHPHSFGPSLEPFGSHCTSVMTSNYITRKCLWCLTPPSRPLPHTVSSKKSGISETVTRAAARLSITAAGALSGTEQEHLTLHPDLFLPFCNLIGLS